jgi:hypothetical protein
MRSVLCVLVLLTACGGASLPNHFAPFARAKPAAPSAALVPISSQPIAPVSLVATDGTLLRLESMRADVQRYGPIAETTLEFTFANESGRQIEGRFRVQLPTNASVTRVAMKIDGRWKQAEAAELRAARTTFDSHAFTI